jgi:hypothetical protein
MNFKQIYGVLEKSKNPDQDAKNIIGIKNKFLTYLDIETILNKVEDKDAIAKLIIREKNDKLDGSDILTIYKSGLKSPHEISKEIINTLGKKINEKDLIYMFHYDKNHDGLKEILKKYFKEDILDKTSEDVGNSYENKLRKEIYNIIKESYLNESFNKNGVVFIKGKTLENGKKKLYAVNIKNIKILDRFNKKNEEREPAKMINFGNNEVFKIIEENNKLIPIKIFWKSEQSILNSLGLNDKSVVLNDKKTPFHWSSLKYENVKEAVNKLSDSLKEIEDVEWK